MYNPQIALGQAISATVGTAIHAVGDRINYDQATYVYAYNAHTTVLPPGKFVQFVTACSGFSVVASSATNALYAGLIQNATVPTGNYFWLLIGGICNPIVSGSTDSTPGTPVYQTAGGAVSTAAVTGISTASILTKKIAVGALLQTAVASGDATTYQIMMAPLA